MGYLQVNLSCNGSVLCNPSVSIAYANGERLASKLDGVAESLGSLRFLLAGLDSSFWLAWWAKTVLFETHFRQEQLSFSTKEILLIRV